MVVAALSPGRLLVFTARISWNERRLPKAAVELTALVTPRGESRRRKARPVPQEDDVETPDVAHQEPVVRGARLTSRASRGSWLIELKQATRIDHVRYHSTAGSTANDHSHPFTARQRHVGRSIAIEVSGEARHAHAQCAMINTIRSKRSGGIDVASALTAARRAG